MRKLLALDLSGAVGASWLTTAGGRPRFDTVYLRGPDLAWRLGQFLVWLEEQYMVDPFDGLAWERPKLMPTDTVDLLELLYGLSGICYGFAGKRKLPWCEVSVEDAKIAITGKGKATKEEMVHAANRTLNWRVSTHHEADAGAVGAVAIERLWPDEAA